MLEEFQGMIQEQAEQQLTQDITQLSVSISQQWFLICDKLIKQGNQLNEKIAKYSIENPELALDIAEDVLAQLPVAVLALNEFGKVAYCNQQAKQLLDADLIGAVWTSVVTEKFNADPDRLGRTGLKNGKIIHISTQAMTKFPGQLITLTDITRDAELEQRLEHLQRLGAMGEMAASLAHQIRTPLAAALLYASHLSSDDLDNEKRKKFVQKTVSRLKHIETQIKDMLSYAKGVSTEFETVYIDELINEILQGAEVSIAQSKSKLVVKEFHKIVKIKCHHDALVGAIQNCIMNAIEAVGHHAHIELICETADNHWINLIVSDESGGIPAHLQQQVLQPFFTTRREGTGLGLSVAKAICETHGGELWLKSTPGVGTQVGFKLPLLQGDAAW